MVTKIKMLQKISLVFIIFIGLCFASCKTLSIQEFKEKYNAIEVDGELVNVINALYVFKFIYKDSIYEVLEPDPHGLAVNNKYKILIDINAPDKNYLVLRHKPVLLDTIPRSEVQVLITNYSATPNYIWVQYKILKSDRKIQDRHKTFFEDLKYLEAIKRYKEQKSKVVVELFTTQRLIDNTAVIAFKINYQKTEDLNKH